MVVKIACIKCNETSGYFLECLKVDQENAKTNKTKGYMCLNCVQGKQVIYYHTDG